MSRERAASRSSHARPGAHAPHQEYRLVPCTARSLDRSMSFNWLSDAELDPHPPFTWLTACCFDLAVRAVVRNAELIPPDFHLEPGTLVLRVEGPAAIEIQHLAEVILERVNRFFGWQAVGRIALRALLRTARCWQSARSCG